MNIDLDYFEKIDIRLGTVLVCEKIKEADKLLRLEIDLGTEKRQVMTAMAEFFPDPNILVGKQIPILVNLKPKRFKGFESQGMVIAADYANKPVFLVPERAVPNGTPVI